MQYDENDSTINFVYWRKGNSLTVSKEKENLREVIKLVHLKENH